MGISWEVLIGLGSIIPDNVDYHSMCFDKMNHILQKQKH